MTRHLRTSLIIIHVIIIITSLLRLNSKWSDGLTLILWQGGKLLAWVTTLVSKLADSYHPSCNNLLG